MVNFIVFGLAFFAIGFAVGVAVMIGAIRKMAYITAQEVKEQRREAARRNRERMVKTEWDIDVPGVGE